MLFSRICSVSLSSFLRYSLDRIPVNVSSSQQRHLERRVMFGQTQKSRTDEILDYGFAIAQAEEGSGNS
jgi:hypothetical protein